MANTRDESVPLHLRPHAREFTFEQSSFYQPLWYRREVALSDGPGDFSELCDCEGDLHVRFPHTVNAARRIAVGWGGRNGAN